MKQNSRLLQLIKTAGLTSTLYFMLHTIKYNISSAKCGVKLRDQILGQTKDKSGLEVGGPSKIFSARGKLPIYSVAKKVDNVNYSSNTVWRRSKNDKLDYKAFEKGKKYYTDATILAGAKKATYDFVISSNCLEHIANPLKALKRWLCALKPSGWLIIIVPRKESNFDRKRILTSFHHMLKDYNTAVRESDLTHLPEILQYHDLRLDPWAGSHQQFFERCRKNIKFRCMHHHIFNKQNLKQVGRWLHLQKVVIEMTSQEYILYGQKGK